MNLRILHYGISMYTKHYTMQQKRAEMCRAERAVHMIILSVLTAVRDHMFILETLRHGEY